MPTEGPTPLLRRVLHRWEAPGASGEGVLRVAIEEMGRELCASECHAHLVSPEDGALLPGSRWYLSPDGPARRAGEPVPPPSAQGALPSRVLEVLPTTAPSDPGPEPPHPISPDPSGALVRATRPPSGFTLTVPLLSGPGMVGILRFQMGEPWEPDPNSVLEIEAVARMVGEALGRLRAHDEGAGARSRTGTLPAESSSGPETLVETAQRGEGETARAGTSSRADLDSLTGLANRELFRKRLQRAIERIRKRPDDRFAVLFLDLDRFKDVNDAFGHVLGDELLVQAARRLDESVRPGDVLARYGGDEFVILLEDVGSVNDVLAVTERIAERLALPFSLEGQDVRLTASVGIALSDTGYGTVEDLLRDADSAMYRAKEEGGGRHRIFDRALREEVAHQGRIRSELRFSLDRGEFSLHYQPVLDLSTRRITGVEALLRWQHPERGLIPAVEFISEAEEMRMILPLGRWVIEEGCRQLRSWHSRFRDEFPLTLSLNLSVRELLDPRLRDWLRESIESSGVRATSLRIEVAESFFSRPMAEVDAALRPLQELGVQIGVDDFGSGPFSLSRLGQAPVDFLKIDRRFVAQLLDENGQDERIVRGILALAASLDLDVVAPGVETGSQEALLRELACPTAQGFHFARPVDAEQTEDLLRRGTVDEER
jgi:diguanylate cyclase (GGDEF)-like protein